MSSKLSPIILKAVDGLLAKPQNIPQKLDRMISCEYSRNDAEIFWSLEFKKILSTSFQAHLVDTPTPEVEIKNQETKLLWLSKLLIIIAIFFTLIFLLVMFSLKIWLGILWVIIIFPTFRFISKFIFRYKGFMGEQMIVSLKSIVKDSIFLPEKTPVNVSGMNTDEIAKQCLSSLPETIAQMGELSSCMLAPNIGQDALGKTLARIAPGLTPDDVIAVIDTTESYKQGYEALSKSISGGKNASNNLKPVEPYSHSLFITTKGFYKFETSSATGKTSSVSADYSSIRFITPKRSKIKKMNTNSLGCYIEDKGLFNILDFYSFEHDFDTETNQDETNIKKVAEVLAAFCRAMQG